MVHFEYNSKYNYSVNIKIENMFVQKYVRYFTTLKY